MKPASTNFFYSLKPFTQLENMVAIWTQPLGCSWMYGKKAVVNGW